MAAPLVARPLLGLLQEAGWRAGLVINYADRLDVVDMNRPTSRDTTFRQAVAERLPARLLLDVHSFPNHAERFKQHDIVLLFTPGVQDPSWLAGYAALLEQAGDSLGVAPRVSIQPAQAVDDIVIAAVEGGQSPRGNMLAEHNEDGDPLLYAALHARAIGGVLRGASLAEAAPSFLVGQRVRMVRWQQTDWSAAPKSYIGKTGTVVELEDTRGRWTPRAFRVAFDGAAAEWALEDWLAPA